MCVYVYTTCTCINSNLKVTLTARRLTIKFERITQIVTLSETDISATLTFTSTLAIYDLLMKRPPDLFICLITDAQYHCLKFSPRYKFMLSGVPLKFFLYLHVF